MASNNDTPILPADENSSDETEYKVTSRSATNTKLPTQHSQAKFRSSVLTRANTGLDGDAEDPSKLNGVLITELKAAYYDDEDDDEIEENVVTERESKVSKSRSSFKTDDINNDETYDTDLEDDVYEELKEGELHDTTGKNEYKKMCATLNVVPCSYFMAHVEDQTLVLKYHQFSSDEVRALAKPLWNNIHVEKLFLDGNWIQGQGVKYISRMIRQNDFITELSLVDNRVGDTVEGVTEICRMLSENCILKKLNLSGNNFSDKSIEQLADALEKNRMLMELDLSHNNFGEESGKILGAFISSNDTLEMIDLSWNNFRNKGAKDLAIGIKENVRLKKCNVSFNGFDTEGGKVLADVIQYNNTLQELNISNTRLTAECAASIANALEVNETLRVLNASNNPITTSGALAIIYGIKLNKLSNIDHLDLSEIPVVKEFERVLKDVLETKPTFVCRHGLVISTSNTKSVYYEGFKEHKVDFEKIIASLKSKS